MQTQITLPTAIDAFRRAARTDDRPALVKAAAMLIEQKAGLANEWLAVARQLGRWGEINMALTALDLWEAQGAPHFEPQNERAVLLARAGRSPEAFAAARAMPADQPSIFANAYLKGSIATNLGENDVAEREFRRTIKALPQSGRSWLGIAQMGRVTRKDEAQIRSLAADDAGLDMTDRAAVQNALGIVTHGRGDHEQAFGHFSRCTKILSEAFRYQPDDNEQSAQIVLKWDRSALDSLAAAAPPSSRKPVFVTGLPRSGTTLVEQIVSAHSRVDGGGELGLALQLEATADGFAPDDIGAFLAKGGNVEQLRDLYLRLVAERVPGEGMFVDKSLNQSRSLGPLSILFPDAPIIWLQRDPLDNAWSIYRAWLANNVVGGWSLGDIAHHMAIEDRLLAHWKELLGDRLLILPYGDLVADPENWVERISRHCGLDLEPLQLTPHLSTSAVSTASAQQVRQPINRKGLGVADPYRAWLAPFVEAYPGAKATPRPLPSAPERTPPPRRDGVLAAAPAADPALLDKTPRDILAQLGPALARRDRAGINALVAALVESKAEIGSQWRALATLLQHNGEHSLALRAAELWSLESDDSPASRFERSAVMAKAGRLSDAADLLDSLPDDVPDALGNAYTKATVALNMGRIDSARDHLRRAVAIDPGSGQAWIALAMAGPMSPEDIEALLGAREAIGSASPLDRAAWHYAVSRVHDDRGDAEAAISALEIGARLVRTDLAYSVSADADDAAAAREGWTPDAIARLASEVDDTPARPIFVTGLPRSGTTLVEQILASHSAVEGGEELGLLRLLEQDIGGKSHGDVERYATQDGSPHALRDLYDYLLAERFPGDARIVDKTLTASRYIGLIASIFPDAPIIWMRRDPLDCAWSAYRTWFLQGLEWSWSPTDIAAHFRIEDALFQHWTDLLGDRILVVDYADLVTDPKTHIKRIVDHCGLALEPAQLAPHKTERSVTTASVAQVREPINLKGIGSAAPYADHMKPFSDAYFG